MHPASQGALQLPVFVYPSPITFYLDDQTTHKQVLTVYNPYEFAVRFRVLCTSPSKFTVVDPEGSIRPRCCIDIVVRHTAVSSTNCNITDKFRVQMQNHVTKQIIGKHDVPATLLPGKPNKPVTDSDDFQHILPSRVGGVPNVQQQFGVIRDPKAGRLQTPNYIVVMTMLVCIVALLLPTEGDQQAYFPSYLHLSPNLKMIFCYVLGLVTMVILKTA